MLYTTQLIGVCSMDIFKFKNPTHPTYLDQGELINGLKTIMWIERYRDICDFELVANAEVMVHKLLPIGTMISHTESTESNDCRKS